VIDAQAETLKTLRAVPPILRALVDGLDEEQARRRPSADEWSVVEVVAHMRDVEQHALHRVRRMLTEENPHLAAFDHEAYARDRKYGDLPLQPTLGEYVELRDTHLDLLTGLDPDGWQRPGSHEVHGAVTVASYEVHVAAEEVDHLAQISRLL
jgi:hypothetical protein